MHTLPSTSSPYLSAVKLVLSISSLSVQRSRPELVILIFSYPSASNKLMALSPLHAVKNKQTTTTSNPFILLTLSLIYPKFKPLRLCLANLKSIFAPLWFVILFRLYNFYAELSIFFILLKTQQIKRLKNVCLLKTRTNQSRQKFARYQNQQKQSCFLAYHQR